MKPKIPIENIYYMLSYAWNRLRENKVVNVNEIESDNPIELFIRIFINSLNNLVKRGLDKDYTIKTEELKKVRGKIQFDETISNLSFKNSRVYCEFDDLNNDTLQNQIVRSTIFNLLKYNEINVETKKKLILFDNYFKKVRRIKLNDKIFKKVKIHKNNYFHGLLIDICELVYHNSLIDEKSGRVKFKDFLQDEKIMPYLFEDFVRNFYKREQKKYRVSRENIMWDIVDFNSSGINYLPIMKTDISLTSVDKKIIIDTKYYKNAMTTNFGNKKLISQNLYQIFSYLKNIEAKGGVNQQVEGILLYPKVNDSINLNYKIQGHNIKIITLDLNQNWININNDLLSII